MTECAVVLLPGLDGTGTLFRPFLDHLPREVRPVVVSYPTDRALGYDELLPFVFSALPTSGPFVLLGESFSGPLALMVASASPAGLRGVILCASFVRSPLPAITFVRHFVRGFCFRFAPEFVHNWALLGSFSSPALRRHSAEAIGAVSPRVLAHRVRAVLKVDVRRELGSCRVPVLYLRGTDDRVVSRRNADEVLAGSTSTQVIELRAPHFVLQAQPAAASAAVSKFVATLSSNPLV